MKIRVDDGLSLTKLGMTGIGWYTKDLLEQVRKSSEFEVSQATWSDTFKKTPAILQRLLYQFFLINKNATAPVDVVHYTNFGVSRKRHRAVVVVTIHDLSPFLVPLSFSILARRFLRSQIMSAMRFADQILVDSNSVKNEIIAMFEPAVSVNVVYPYQKARVEGAVNREKERYLLCVGVLDKRKNLEFLCRAFLASELAKSGYTLRLVGKPGYGFEQLKPYLGDSIQHIPYSAEELLHSLYLNAAAFVFPSLYEGFGKPVVEAMSYSLPIIASEIPTNLELDRNHGRKMRFFPLGDLAALVKQIESVPDLPDTVSYDSLDLYEPTRISESLFEIYRRAGKQ